MAKKDLRERFYITKSTYETLLRDCNSMGMELNELVREIVRRILMQVQGSEFDIKVEYCVQFQNCHRRILNAIFEYYVQTNINAKDFDKKFNQEFNQDIIDSLVEREIRDSFPFSHTQESFTKENSINKNRTNIKPGDAVFEDAMQDWDTSENEESSLENRLQNSLPSLRKMKSLLKKYSEIPYIILDCDSLRRDMQDRLMDDEIEPVIYTMRQVTEQFISQEEYDRFDEALDQFIDDIPWKNDMMILPKSIGEDAKVDTISMLLEGIQQSAYMKGLSSKKQNRLLEILRKQWMDGQALFQKLLLDQAMRELFHSCFHLADKASSIEPVEILRLNLKGDWTMLRYFPKLFLQLFGSVNTCICAMLEYYANLPYFRRELIILPVNMIFGNLSEATRSHDSYAIKSQSGAVTKVIYPVVLQDVIDEHNYLAGFLEKNGCYDIDSVPYFKTCYKAKYGRAVYDGELPDRKELKECLKNKNVATLGENEGMYWITNMTESELSKWQMYAVYRPKVVVMGKTKAQSTLPQPMENGRYKVLVKGVKDRIQHYLAFISDENSDLELTDYNNVQS